MMKKYFLLLVFINYLYSIICKDCDATDLGQHITKCENNKRQVFNFWKNNCTINSNTNLLQPKMVENIDCDLKCEQGEYFFYNQNENKLTCQKCPANSYSVGGDFRICGEKREWSEEVLSKFKNVCFVKCEGEESYKINENCENWKINEKHSNITTGFTNIAEGTYVAELKYTTFMKNSGKLSFGYTKKTKKDEEGKLNGEFKFYVNYQEVQHDKNITDEFTDFYYDLEKGDHSFMWTYYYTKNISSGVLDYSDYKMNLKYIMIEGMDDGAYECISCSKVKNPAASFSKEGWNHCETCKFGEYFVEEEQSCKNCTENTFSYPNSEGLSSCLTRPQCNEYDYREIHSECVDDKIEVKYEWEQPITCNSNLYKLPLPKMETCNDTCQCGYFKDVNSDNKKRCDPCTEGEYSDQSISPYKCNICPDGSFAPRVINITKFHIINSDKDDFFCVNQCIGSSLGLCEIYNFKGWKFIRDGIIPGNNLPTGIELILVKDINIVQDIGFIEFIYEIFGFNDQECFSIFVDDVAQAISTAVNTNHTKKFPLSNGQHKIKFTFKREKGSISQSSGINSMIIRAISIYGSDEGGAAECIKCPTGYISKKQELNYVSKCIKCESGYIPNTEQTECQLMKEIPDDEETNCPEYSYLDDSKRCLLYDIIHNKSFLLRFFLHDIKHINHHKCKMTDHKNCKNQFIGPIFNQNESEEPEDNSIFYISLNNKDKLEVKDFTFAKENKICSSGHAFALFESKNYTESDTKKSNEYQIISNTKILKNIGSKIEKITLMPGAPYFHYTSPGILIKYSNGDVCLSNPNLRYSFYIFLTCDKSGIYYPPKYLGKINHNCTFVFEWETRNGCPSCLKKNLTPVQNGCFNNTEEIRYEENLNCAILNEDESKFSGHDTFSNRTSTVLSKELIITDPVFSFYFWKKNFIKDENDWEKIIGVRDKNLLNKNFTLDNKDIYVDYKKEILDCSSTYKVFEDISLVFLIVIPTFYLITSFCMIVFYCKFRRINNDYQRLRLRENENNIATIIHDGTELHMIPDQPGNRNI